MCGIVGMVSREPFSSKELMASLKRLEYRGYDSFGFATNSGHMEKFTGDIDAGRIKDVPSNAAISHVRWATHGGVTMENAHPHSDCSGDIFIVHNGIISNYMEIKNALCQKGHVFRSETDSEIIAHFFEDALKLKDMKGAVKEFFSVVDGEFAVLLARKGDDNVYAFKRGSPLVLGLADKKKILASDIYAFSNETNAAIFFNEDEFSVVNPFGYEFYRYDGSDLSPVKKEIATIELQKNGGELEAHEHYMIKEITEEPAAAQRLINSLKTEQHEKVMQLKSMIESSKRVVFIASGTSYHASLFGVYFLNKAGIEAHTIIASEFRNFTLLDENTLVIAVSQSGETMDVIEALHGIKAKGVKVASVVNVPYSTIQRMSNLSINICAGHEICVAATKTFVNQVTALLYLASAFGYKADVEKLPRMIEEMVNQHDTIKSVAAELKDSRDIFVIGRGFSYPVAMEIALKLKEISYIHAEGMMGGELKHGTLALIEKGTPVIVLMPKSDSDIVSNAREIEARGGKIIAFSENEGIKINAVDKASFSILATIAGQLLTYYIAKEKGLPIDKPRNLAKCVTVK